MKETYCVAGLVVHGYLPSGMLGTIQVGAINQLNIYLVGGEVITASCIINNPSSEVNLGLEYAQRFRNKGDVGEEVEFHINITCESNNLRPAFIFDGNTDSEFSTAFKNSSGLGYAENVGIQLLRKGQVIVPREIVSLGSVATTATDHSFSARVIRLGGSMTPGSVDVPVTFVLYYE